MGLSFPLISRARKVPEGTGRALTHLAHLTRLTRLTRHPRPYAPPALSERKLLATQERCRKDVCCDGVLGRVYWELLLCAKLSLMSVTCLELPEKKDSYSICCNQGEFLCDVTRCLQPCSVKEIMLLSYFPSRKIQNLSDTT